uniref:Uncharacterized protein n=1 Tax=Helianthus annuus TaxID=4232 RepID=A0A251V2Z5_HELAN
MKEAVVISTQAFRLDFVRRLPFLGSRKKVSNNVNVHDGKKINIDEEDTILMMMMIMAEDERWRQQWLN